jgi:heme/copper-type cytochrome/quinol oxidase subunit 2
MDNFKKIKTISIRKCILTLLMLLPVFSYAQQPVEMADTFRSNGKIYVVLLVICTIFAGIILFLVYLERKIKKLEQNQKG